LPGFGMGRILIIDDEWAIFAEMFIPSTLNLHIDRC
jgi:hypothetical protein